MDAVLLSWMPLGTPTVAVITAATTGQPLEVYGPLGIVLAALGVFMREIIKGIIQDRDRAYGRLDSLTNQLMNEAMPVLKETAKALERREQTDAKLIAILERLG